MITVKEIVEKRPHLKDVFRLYEKVGVFERTVIGLNINITAEDITYPPESVDVIFKSFSTIFDVPEDFLSPLKGAMAAGKIDLFRLPLNGIAPFSLPYQEDEFSGVLFLISKPFFIQLGNSLGKRDPMFWEEGRCPVCNALPSLSFIRQDGARKLHCSYCGYAGLWHRRGCPNCQNRDSLKLDIIETEEEKGIRIDLCNECKSYVKTADNNLLDDYTPDLLEIISIPLDIIAQGRGYRRRSPNPVGMITMI
jgi:FdhE protein